MTATSSSSLRSEVVGTAVSHGPQCRKENGPLSRSPAADADYCIMVRVHRGPTEYKHAGATVALTGRAPLGLMQSATAAGKEELLLPVLGGE